MLELIGLVVALTGVASVARGRGARPWLAPSIAFLGWFFFEVVLQLFTRDQDIHLGYFVAGWAWIAAVGVYFRFAVGRQHPQPDSKWSCSNCFYMNNASAVVCEACQQPWRKSAT